jgi:hypothetical protein
MTMKTQPWTRALAPGETLTALEKAECEFHFALEACAAAERYGEEDADYGALIARVDRAQVEMARLLKQATLDQ